MNGTERGRGPEVLNSGRGPRRLPGSAWARSVRARITASRLGRVTWPAPLRRLSRALPGRHRPDLLWLIIGILVAVVIVQGVGRPAPSGRSATGHGASREAPVLTAVIAQAALPALHDYVRPRATPGTCRQARLGYAPDQAASTVLARVLPGLSVADHARTFDQSAALCSVLVRARDGHGTTLIIEVIAPVRPVTDRTLWLTSAVQVDGGTQTKYVSATISAGWTIRVGVTGPVEGQASADQLFMVALDPALTW